MSPSLWHNADAFPRVVPATAPPCLFPPLNSPPYLLCPRSDRIILLNRLTQLINFWQDEEVKHTVEEARAEFPDCAFAIA